MAELEEVAGRIAASKTGNHFFVALAITCSKNCRKSLEELEKAETPVQAITAFKEAAYS